MKRLAALLLGLLLFAPAVAQAQVLAYPSGVAGLTVNNCATTNRLLYLSSTGVTGCSTLSYDGADVTLASGVLILPAGTFAAPSLRSSAGAGFYFGSSVLYSSVAFSVFSSATESAVTLPATLTGPVRLGSTGNVTWTSGSHADAGAVDTGVGRSAARVVEANTGTAAAYADFIARSISLNSATVSGSSPGITVGSGTGVTVNYAADVRTTTYKVTVAYTNCIAAAVTCDLTIATLPAKTYLKRVVADLTTTYACAATCTTATLSATLGTSAGGNDLLVSFDLDAAAAQFGDADAELGSAMNSAAVDVNGAKNVGVLFSWSGTTTLTYRITSGTGNLGTGSATNLSQGSVTFFLTTEVL